MSLPPAKQRGEKKKVSTYFKLQSDKLLASWSHWIFSSQLSICRGLWPVFCLITSLIFCLLPVSIVSYFLSLPLSFILHLSIQNGILLKNYFTENTKWWTTKNTVYDDTVMYIQFVYDVFWSHDSFEWNLNVIWIGVIILDSSTVDVSLQTSLS